MIEGGCRCGAVRYRIARDDVPPAYACHCHICQRATGSAFSVQVLVPEATLTVEGPLDVVEVTTDDRVSTQRFCAACHARIHNTNSARPGIAVVRGGTLDRSEELGCHAHIYTAFRQAWVAIPAAVPSWPDAAPVAEFIAAMTNPVAEQAKT